MTQTMFQFTALVFAVSLAMFLRGSTLVFNATKPHGYPYGSERAKDIFYDGVCFIIGSLFSGGLAIALLFR